MYTEASITTLDAVQATATGTDCDGCWTESDISKTREMAFAMMLRDLAQKLVYISYLPISLFGIIGNSLAFYIMIRKSFISSTYCYLCALCIMDNIYLVVNLATWLTFAVSDGKFDLRQIIDCNVIHFLLEVSQLTSAWLVVTISVERMAIVYYPTKAKVITKITRARAAVACMVGVVVGLNWLHIGGLITIRHTTIFQSLVCVGRTKFIHDIAYGIGATLKQMLYAFLPALVIVIVNACTVAKFASASCTNKVSATASGVVSEANSTSAGSQSRTMAKYSRRMAVTGLLLSTTFVVLTFPWGIYDTLVNRDALSKGENPADTYNLYLIGRLLSTFQLLNHAINFVLYCMTSTRIRKDFKMIVTCKAMKKTKVSVFVVEGAA